MSLQIPAARQQEEANLKSKLEIAATITMVHPEWLQSGGGAARMFVNRESASDIKRMKKEVYRTCIPCGKAESKETPFKMCDRCHSMFYCSKECQKVDWRKHKKYCRSMERHKRLETIVAIIVTNKDFMGYLKIATILCLDLINSPAIDQPFYVAVHLGIEPANIVDFARLRGQISTEPAGVADSASEIQGMVQVNDVFRCPDGLINYEDLLPLWRTKRADADADGFVSHSVGIMLFSIGNFITVAPVPVHITSLFVDIARNLPPFQQIIMGNTAQRPQMMDVVTCIEYINTTIRLDRANNFLLRTDMTAEDEKIIRDTFIDALVDKSAAVGLLRGRMVRETIYRVLLGL